jgi:uncharacterized protein YcaQ
VTRTPSGALTIDEARRIALDVQGLSGRRPKRAGRAEVLALVRRLGAIQLDGINVLTKAQYLAPFARLGPYDREHLHALAYQPPRPVLEHMLRASSYIPIELHPAASFRYELMRGDNRDGRWLRQHRELADRIIGDIRDKGGATASQLTPPANRKSGGWWNWADEKVALEVLWMAGELQIAGRRGVERVYDLPERVLPPEVLAAPRLEEAEARRRLALMAVGALGVATADDVADYTRMNGPKTKVALRELTEAGAVEPVSVEGWDPPAYLVPGTAVPRAGSVDARALLSPFDPMVCHRPRIARLWDVQWRTEIYVPKDKRVYGYYVMPFLLGEELAARVDLKSDTKTATMIVEAAYQEPTDEPRDVVGPLAAELRLMAEWLELERIVVADRGDLAGPLRRVLG